MGWGGASATATTGGAWMRGDANWAKTGARTRRTARAWRGNGEGTDGRPAGEGEHALTLEFPTYLQTTPSDRNRGGTREYPELAKAMESAPPVLTVVEK